MRSTTLIKNSGIYSVIALLQKGINFFLIPILTVYLSPTDYGVVAVVTAISAFLNVFFVLGLNGSLNRFYYEYKDDQLLIKKLFGTVISFVLLNSVLLTGILLVFKNWLLLPFLNDVSFYPYMLLGIVSVLFNPIFTIYQNALQARQEGIAFGKNNLLFFILNICFILLLVVVFKMGAKGVLAALAITNICVFFFTLIQFRKHFIFGINKPLLKQALQYALPLVPHQLSKNIVELIDRLVINKLLDTAMVGLYTLGSNFGGLVFYIASGVNQAYAPWFNQKVKENNLKALPKIAIQLTLLFCFFALGISLFSKELIVLLTPNIYHEAWRVVPIIAFSFVLHAVYYFYAAPYFYDIKGKGNRVLVIGTISSAILNLVLNYMLIPIYGIFGAALATLICKFLLVVFLSKFYHKHVAIPYNNAFLIFVPILFLGIALIAYLPVENERLFLVFKIVVYMLLSGIFLIYNYKTIKQLLGNIWNNKP